MARAPMFMDQIPTLHIDWKLVDQQGSNVATVSTAVKNDEGRESYPNSQDPQYFDDYVKLAKRNAEDFIAQLNSQPPIWGKDSIGIWETSTIVDQAQPSPEISQ